MSMRDEVGSSEVSGVLIINGDHFKIKLEKTYDDRDSAGQTDEYDILLYEGAQEGEEFYGNWSYKNFEMDPECSGTWRLFHE